MDHTVSIHIIPSVYIISYRWLHNMHTVKCKHPIPITYTLRNNLHVKLELYILLILVGLLNSEIS